MHNENKNSTLYSDKIKMLPVCVAKGIKGTKKETRNEVKEKKTGTDYLILSWMGGPIFPESDSGQRKL